MQDLAITEKSNICGCMWAQVLGNGRLWRERDLLIERKLRIVAQTQHNFASAFWAADRSTLPDT